MKRLNTLLLCTVGALSAASAQAAFLQPGKIIAGSDMTFFPYEYIERQ
nr:extracellular solute-binding protein [Raoultella sp. NCTC 9187]